MIDGLERLSSENILLGMENANGEYGKYFSVLYDRYKERLYRFSLSILEDKREAEDNVQETFEKVHKSFRDFNPKYAFATWIYSISRHNALDKLKKKNNVCFSTNDCFTAHAGRMNLGSEDITIEEHFSRLNGLEDSPEERMIIGERNERLKAHLDKIRGANNGLLDLLYFKERSYQEISSELGISINAVKGRSNKARNLLKEKLSGKNYA